MNYLVKGDCHGDFLWLYNLDRNEYPCHNTACILLGDVGLNFFLNNNDKKMKKVVNEQGYKIYCLRGNHEERPENIPTMIEAYDVDVNNFVFLEKEYPNIRYLKDGYFYKFDDYKALCIGGAYSVDKWYRLERAGLTEKTNNPKKTGWFAEEQLTNEEMDKISKETNGAYFDFVFTHTAPISFEPTDLFLGFVDQSKVDKSMEIWLDELRQQITYGVWCFGHYHADRIERPHVEQYFKDIEELDTIWERWKRYDRCGQLDWWLTKAPLFYEG